MPFKEDPPQLFSHILLFWLYKPVADPGFDIRGGVDFVNGGGGRKSLKVLKVEVKVII